VGTGSPGSTPPTGIGRPAAGVSSEPLDVELSPDGKVVVIESFGGRRLVWTIEPPLPQFSIGEYVIPNEDGSELYHFDALGRRLETFDGLTGATLLTFSSTASGALDTIADPHGNVTRVLRDGTGRPTGIEAPFGQVTQLRTTPAGFLDRITNPAGEAISLPGSSNGLLSSITREGGATVSLAYDPFGRTVRRDDEAWSFRAFTRTFDARGRGVTTRTAGGRTRGADIHRDLAGERGIVRTGFEGLPTAITQRRDGGASRTTPDGTAVEQRETADPRLGISSSAKTGASIRSAFTSAGAMACVSWVSEASRCPPSLHPAAPGRGRSCRIARIGSSGSRETDQAAWATVALLEPWRASMRRSCARVIGAPPGSRPAGPGAASWQGAVRP
jgi:YD repeat-containing protein